MNKQNTLILALLTFVIGTQHLYAADALNYTLQLNEARDRINVTLEYHPESKLDTFEFMLPSNYDRMQMSQTVTVQHLQLLSKGELIQVEAEKYQVLNPSSSIRLSYTLPTFSKDPSQLPCSGDDYFIPAINTQFFHLYGDKSLIVPHYAINDRRKFDLTMGWVDFPEVWHIANDLGISKVIDGKRQTQHAEGLLLADIGNSLFIGGEYTPTGFSVGNKNFHLYLYGEWKLDEALLIEEIEQIAQAELSLWSHFNHDNDYVISITQKGKDDCGRMGGRNMYNSFCFYLPGKFTNDHIPLFYSSLVHEFTHTWIGVDIVVNNPAPASMKWFTEGFTDYYANRICLKTGYFSHAQYIAQLNESISAYLLSPYRSLTLKEFQDGYLYDERLENFAYDKGAVFAFYLDGYFRAQSEGQVTLDDFMAALFKDSSAQKMNRNLTNDFINSIAKEEFNQDISDLIATYIVEGAIIPISSPLIKATRTNEKIDFEYGFDYINSINTETICGVKENSNAYKAGLRSGQQFLALYHMTSDPNGKMILGVSDDQGKHKIEYNPQGERVTLPVITELRQVH